MWTILAGHINSCLSFAGEKGITFPGAPFGSTTFQSDTPETDLLALTKFLPLVEVLEHFPRGWAKKLAVAVTVTDVALFQTPLGLFPIFLFLSCLFLSEQFILFKFLSCAICQMASRKLGWRILP